MRRAYSQGRSSRRWEVYDPCTVTARGELEDAVKPQILVGK
jgi:hypothetical protein